MEIVVSCYMDLRLLSYVGNQPPVPPYVRLIDHRRSSTGEGAGHYETYATTAHAAIADSISLARTILNRIVR